MPYPTQLHSHQQDFIGVIKKEFGEIVEAYMVCVLAGIIPDLRQLDAAQQERIRHLAKNRGIVLPR